MSARRFFADSGFTLLEVLLALAILAAGTTLTLSLISGSLGNIRKVQLRARAIQHAETVMELSLLDESIRQPATLRGDFADGTRWSVQVSEFELPDANPPVQQFQQFEMPVKLLSYKVEVIGPDSNRVDFRLETLKMIGVSEAATPFEIEQ